MTLRETIISMNNKAKSLQESYEQVDELRAVQAFSVINYIKYINIADIFLACASLNLLNTYIKQTNSKIDYTFKRHFSSLLKGIEDVGSSKLKVIYSNEEKLLVLVFWDFQFSFHCPKPTDIIIRLESDKNIPWDGVRKQRCANTIFDLALANPFISNITMFGESLSDLIDQQIESYNAGNFRFVRGNLIQFKLKFKERPQIDTYQKNYIRRKLFDCQDRPVILTGIFKKVWPKHVTFTTIRPYIPGCSTLTICDHINLLRTDVEQVYNINDFVVNKRYFIIGRCREYPNKERMRVNLDLQFKPSPLFRVRDYNKMPKNIFDNCHRFDIEEYIACKQKSLRL